MNLSKNFTLEELIYSDTANQYNIDNTPTQEIIDNLTRLANDVLQPIRDKYNKPIIISSGYRCEELNAKVGGVSNSAHKYGLGADLDVGGVKENKELFLLIKEMIDNKEIEVDQLINENHYKWCHIGLSKNNNRNQILYL